MAKNFIDNSRVWHPFTQMKTAPASIPIASAKGIYLHTSNGERYIDGTSSWWVNLHGHTHPVIAAAIKKQVEILEHVLFAGCTHAPAEKVACQLLDLLPAHFAKIFYSDNGSTAVKVAIKMALQYWYNRDPYTQKTKIICFHNSYHGDTFGAMSAAGKNNFNVPFWRQLFEVVAIDAPTKGKEEESLRQLKQALQQEDVACFIFEPLVLAAGGMVIYSHTALESLLKACKEHHVLTIVDEVMTGCGRVGPLFACSLISIQPDIICLAKGLTGGFLPLGVTACSQDVFDAFFSDDIRHTFLHGHSYTANPLACASASASLQLLATECCSEQRTRIAKHHESFCKRWRGHPALIRCEHLETLLVVEYQSSNHGYFNPIRDRLYQLFLRRGILLRPLGNVVYVLPPYCIQEEELDEIYEAIVYTLEEII